MHPEIRAGKPCLKGTRITVYDVLEYLAREPPGQADPPFEVIVRGRPGARFPSAVDKTQAEEDEDLAALRLPRPRHADS